MLTLFILKSGDPNAAPEKTVTSFAHMNPKVKMASDIKMINATEKRTKWYAVMYDNERLDQNLMEALPIHLTFQTHDIIVLFKRNDKDEMTMAPRIFRAEIKLRDNCLLPDGSGLKFDRALDGWIE